MQSVKYPALISLVFLAIAAMLVVLAGPPKLSFANRVNVSCANTTADAATINTAITGSSAGDEIVIDGPCLLNATIKLLGDRSYRGESRTGTILLQANSSNLTAMFASDSYENNSAFVGQPLSVRSLTLDGNKANNTGTTVGIMIRSWQTVIEDVDITDMDGDGIRITEVSANGTHLSNTLGNGVINNSFIEYSGGHGISVVDSENAATDWMVTHNFIAYSGVDAIHSDNVAGWQISDNHIYGVQQNAIYAHRMYNTTIANNSIDDIGETTTVGTWYGIYGTVQGGKSSTVVGNRIFTDGINASSTYRYLALYKVNYGDGKASVTGNVIRGANTSLETGLYYAKGGGTSLTVSSTGNNVADVGTQRFIGTGVTVDTGL